MYYKRKSLMSLFLIILLALHSAISAKPLDRRASWQASFQKLKTQGVEIKSINKSSPLNAIDIVKGDVLLEVNGTPINTAEHWYDITDALVADIDIKLTIKSADTNMIKSKTIQFSPIPLESYKSLITDYEQVTSDYGIKQRVIITRPKNTVKTAAVIILQGLSCSSIEKIPNKNNNYMRLLTDIVQKSELAVMRIEKPGLGDSEGNCSQTDFKTELNGYESAIKYLLTKDYVDKSKVIVYGNSLGSAIAPYIVNKYGLAGVISDGTYMRTWFEHMLEIERRIRKIQGDTEAEITKKMNQAYIPLYYGMLLQKRSYEEIIKDNPSLASYNYHGLNHMYGRPMSFYHQLQEFDVAGEWEKLKAPARIRWGTNDWIMSEYDNDLIIKVLNDSGHTDHQLIKLPNMDHWSTIHEDYKSSFNGNKGKWEPKISQQILDWISELTKS